MVDEKRDVLRPFTQWRQFNGKNAEPVEEVGAKFTIVDHLSEITMCGADHAHISVNRGGTAETFELSFLDDTKKFWLQLKRKVADLVQKQSAVVSPLKPSNTARDRAGEGATLMSEQFAFQQTGRNSGAVHLHKGAIRSVAALVNGFSNQFLACSCFPVDQDRGVGRRYDPHHSEDASESRASTDNGRHSAAAEFPAFEGHIRRRRIPDVKGCLMVN